MYTVMHMSSFWETVTDNKLNPITYVFKHKPPAQLEHYGWKREGGGRGGEEEDVDDEEEEEEEICPIFMIDYYYFTGQDRFQIGIFWIVQI